MKKNTEEEGREYIKYCSAIREFVKETIENSTFFEKTPEEQKQRASEVLEKHIGKKNVKEVVFSEMKQNNI